MPGEGTPGHPGSPRVSERRARPTRRPGPGDVLMGTGDGGHRRTGHQQTQARPSRRDPLPKRGYIYLGTVTAATLVIWLRT
ncbi:hypothetical protein GPN2_23434 [Streptomyces murinus]